MESTASGVDQQNVLLHTILFIQLVLCMWICILVAALFSVIVVTLRYTKDLPFVLVAGQSIAGMVLVLAMIVTWMLIQELPKRYLEEKK